MPKLMALALRRMSVVDALRRDPEDLAGGALVHVLACGKRRAQDFVARGVGQNAQVDLGVIRREQFIALGRDESPPNLLAQGLRMGMFCRFGSRLERRPVAVPVWSKWVWTRPVAGSKRPKRPSI